MTEEIEWLQNKVANWKAEAFRVLDIANAKQDEIERLQETVRDREVEIADHLREIERLRADNERLRATAGNLVDELSGTYTAPRISLAADEMERALE